VLADATSAIKPLSPATIPLVMSDSAAQLSADYIFDFEIDAAVRPGKMTLVDYNDTQTKRLEGSSAAAEPKPSAKKLELYDYPGKFDAVSGGERYAKLRLEAEEAIGRVARGVSSSRRLMVGRSFGVEDPYSNDFGGEKFQPVSLTHQATTPIYGGEEAFRWETRFAATPATTVFRPLHQTPKSIVHGTQTAVVVGTPGEEIYVDKFGRVKVQFFWDRLGKNDEKSSCWVRVSSAWAGKGWGVVYVPRIGQEVVVDFLEGDPDRPIITGRVYNSEQTVPYALPANGTQSGIKSHSSKGGEIANTNEFRFEDKKGSEEIYLHAEKDLNAIVLNDETRTVGANRTTEIKKDDKKVVKEGDEVTTIEKGSRTVSVDTGDQKHIIKKGNVTTSVDMGNVEHTVKMGDVDHKVKMGNVTTKLDLGKDTTEAMQSIEFKVGQSSVKIDQMGVTIKGMMIKIEGQVQTDIKGMMTNVKADAMLMVKGAITMIN
jgi:type VI secretion system secreted protein VgrG